MSESTYHLEHQKKISEQNKLLDELHNSVMNTRQYAVQIGDELHQQDGMLNDLHQDIQRTSDESRRQNRNVIQLLRESESRGFYSIVIFLVVVLIILLMI